EVGNSIFMGYSNKAHDGFLGNSVIGEWCNLGANTNNSNLKNDYKEVTLYDYNLGELAPTEEIFCGTFMGDYTKAGISTMFNTGTVIGVCSNVFGGDFQEKFIPSFTWGGKMAGYENYRFDKAIDVIIATMSRRNLSLSEVDIEILRWVNVQKSVKKLT
ncbi:MAG: glucose-1-phosphate thymidylyltransferase, partial [Spirosomaceae bacterium]|nr:glucose-1-phosphate thymidylyltransferase [Spirosomataceae bacterium]